MCQRRKNVLGTHKSKELEAAQGVWLRAVCRRERARGREGERGSVTRTPGSIVTWGVKVAAVWIKILSAEPGHPGQSSRAKRKVSGLRRQKGSQREKLRQRKLTERFEERGRQNPSAGTTAHSLKGSESPEKESQCPRGRREGLSTILTGTPFQPTCVCLGLGLARCCVPLQFPRLRRCSHPLPDGLLYFKGHGDPPGWSQGASFASMLNLCEHQNH